MTKVILSLISVIFILQLAIGISGSFGVFRKICPKYDRILASTNFIVFIILVLISAILT